MAVAILISAVRSSSVDTQKRLPYNPHRTYPKKPDSLTAVPTANSNTTPIKNIANISISDLLKRDIYKSGQVEIGGTYLGYETWLPTPPKVEKPRSVFNPALLAYIGDCIYELYARKHFLLPPLDIEEFNNRVMAVVRCEAQDAMLQKLISDDFLSQEESCLMYMENCKTFLSSWQKQLVLLVPEKIDCGTWMCYAGGKISPLLKQEQRSEQVWQFTIGHRHWRHLLVICT